MAYTFTPTQTYALSTHEVVFTDSHLKVKLSSSGQSVYNQDFSGGIAFRCDGNDFQIGTLKSDNYLSKSVDLAGIRAKLWLVEKADANQFIGTNDTSDDSIYNIFNLNQCPVLLSKTGTNAVMKCPCEGKPCTNGCYKYGV